MRFSRVLLYLFFVEFAWLGGCKKAEQPAPPKAESSQETASSPKETAPAQPAQETVPTGESMLLKIKWPVGDRFVYRMDLDQRTTNKVPQMPKPIEQDLSMAITYSISVIKELPNEGRDLELSVLANEMEIKMGGQTMMNFDSKEIGKDEAQNPFAVTLRKMIGSKVHLELDANGKVTNVVGYQEWVTSVMGDTNGPAASILGQQFNESFLRQIAGFGIGLPEKPVRIGEHWPFKTEVPAGPVGKITIESTVSFKGWEQHAQHKCAALTFAGTLAGSAEHDAGPMGKMSIDSGKVTGSSWLDPESGTMMESAQDQTMRLKGELQGITYSIDLGQKVTVKLVEQGKINP